MRYPVSEYKYFHDGECLTTPAPETDCGLIDCPQIEKPLCGLPKGFCAEPKTFNNKCYLEVYNCFNSNEREYFEQIEWHNVSDINQTFRIRILPRWCMHNHTSSRTRMC